jgi:tricorn protease
MLPGLLLTSLQTSPILRSPDIFGDTVVFTCEGDLWLGDLGTGRASRMTRDVGTEFDARFSPDGKWIAYTGELDGVREVYVVPVAGGAPKRLTYLNDYAEAVEWLDNGTLIFRGRSPMGLGVSTLYRVSISGGMPQRMPLEFASWATMLPDGRMVFNRYNRYGVAWFRYKGGMTNSLWIGDFGRLEFRKLYNGNSSLEYPTFASGRVYFMANDGGKFSLQSVNVDGAGVRREGPETKYEIRSIQGDGKRIVYEEGATLRLLDPASGTSRELKFDLLSDMLHTRAYSVPAEATVFSSSIGPTGKRVLVESRGQLLSLPTEDGEARVVLAMDGVRLRAPAYSPDGKHIAFFGDQTGEMQLYVCDSDGQHVRQVSKDTRPRQLRSLLWSPDSKWIGYSTNRREIWLCNLETDTETHVLTCYDSSGWNAGRFSFSPDSKWIAFENCDYITGFSSINLYEIASKRKIKVSSGISNDFGSTFSPDGKYLGFLSRRNLAPSEDAMQNQLNLQNTVKPYLLTLRRETPSPFGPKEAEEGEEPKKEESKDAFAIDLDGLYQRFIELPVPPSDYSSLMFAGDRVLLSEPGAIRFINLTDQKQGVVASGDGNVELSRDGKKLLIANGADLRVVDASGQNQSTDTGKVSFGGLQLRIEPKSEWQEMFWDAWRQIRDYFYVENMHGVDWKAVGQQYAAMLPSVRSRDELSQLLRWMLAETGTSHTAVVGGDVRSLVKPAAPAFLGADLVEDRGYLKIKTIFRGGDFLASERSPLAGPGVDVKEGEYLVEVAGKPVRSAPDWQEALLGRAGQVVAIKVNSNPTLTGARTVRVKPVASELRMRYLQWVEDRRAYVDRATGGKVGYLHVRSMSEADMGDFIRQYYAQRNKDALVVDVRFNTGGWISDSLLRVLKQRVIGFFNERNGALPFTRQTDYFAGPMVCLVNEFNISNGEEFPFGWRALKLGPIVGKRTRGGEIGSDPGWSLSDGGLVYVPNYGMYTEKDGWVIEGPGVAPDIEIDNDPNLYARGKDPQLDKGIELMLESLRKNPVKRPPYPPDPIRIK